MLRKHICKSSRLFISILVIQDHIESIGKPILLKGDGVLLNGLLAQVLSHIAPEPSATLFIQICQNPKLQLGPTDSFYPAPPSSYDIATARNPKCSVTPIRISVSPRWPCQRSVICCIHFGPTEFMQSVSPSWLDRFSVAYCFASVSPSWWNRRHRDDVCHKPYHIGPIKLF